MDTIIQSEPNARTLNPNLTVIIERRNWLVARIAAKKSVGWDTEWDQRECDAHSWAIDTICRESAPGEEEKRRS